MSGAITREEYDIVKRMIRGSNACWYLLELPNGQWGALWWAGLAIENAANLTKDDYRGLGFTGTQKEAQEFIYQDLLEKAKDERTPFDMPSKRMFQHVKSGRQIRMPRFEHIF